LGKIIGGGFPVGAIVGKQEPMSVLDPGQTSPPFPLSGTFSANPISMTAGLATLQAYDQDAVDRINDLGGYARRQMTNAIENSGTPACVTGAGSMFRIHLKETPPTDYRSAWQDPQESARVKRLVDYLYHSGFMLINTCTGALSTAIGKQEIDKLAEALESGLKNGKHP
jgi:glutamate-1-semialdehyde 2,1-aminomutase